MATPPGISVAIGWIVCSILIAAAQSVTAQNARASASDTRMISTIEYGTLDRVRLAGGVEIEGEYPSEELRRSATGHADLGFRLGADGYVTETLPSVYTSDAFYDAARRMLQKIRFIRTDVASSADTLYKADIDFKFPPCIAKQPSSGRDFAITVCAGHDPDSALQWDQTWPAGPVDPAAFNQSTQNGQDRKLQFEGRWQGARGWTEFDSGTIRSDGAVLGGYSVMVHEEFVAVLEISSDLYFNKYWRLDAVDYRRCQTARDGLACAQPYEPSHGLDLTMYANLDDALALRSEQGKLHYFSRSRTGREE